jgi:hypothetical protein
MSSPDRHRQATLAWKSSDSAPAKKVRSRPGEAVHRVVVREPLRQHPVPLGQITGAALTFRG